MKLLAQEERPLLARKELLLEFDFPNAATPKKAELQKQIASHFKAEETMVAVKKIKTQYGSNTAKVSAFIYSDPEQMKVLEAKKVKKENAAKAAPAK